MKCCVKANLRRAGMCSRQTGRSQSARRRQRSPRFGHRAADKTGPRQCRSGSQQWPGQRLTLALISWILAVIHIIEDKDKIGNKIEVKCQNGSQRRLG